MRMRTRLARFVISIALLAGLTACRHTYGLERQIDAMPLPSSAKLYVALPEPGAIEGRVYEDSGRQTGEAIVRTASPHVARAVLADVSESAERARESAESGGATHLVYPEILHWEDRATEWSGKPDRIRIRLQVFEVASGKLVNAAEVTGKSRWGTFGGDHPQDLLDRAVGDYMQEVFAATAER